MTDHTNRNPRAMDLYSRSGAARLAAPILISALLGVAPPALAQDGEVAAAELQPADEMVTFSATSEPIELMDVLNFITEELGINVSVKGTITGTVMFNAQQQVPRSQLLALLEALLNQYNYSLTLDPVGIYTVQPATDIPGGAFEGVYATTKIITTPNVKPSSLRAVLDPAAAAAGGQSTRQIAYVDDLGIIVITDTPRRVRAMEELIQRVLEQFRRATYTRIDLDYVAAMAARERAISLVGQGASLRTGIPGQDPNASLQIPGMTNSLDNLADRLTIDPSGNALIFRGTEDEVEQVRSVLQIIDVPTTLTPKEYKAGANAAMIADIASQRGLGQVIRLEDTQNANTQQTFFGPGNFGRGGNQFQNQNTTQSTLGGGSVMMVDEVRGTILYYGTEKQQEQLGALIDALQLDLEEIVIERYPVRNVDAKELADLLQAIIENQSGTDSPLLPGARNQQGSNQQSPIQRFLQGQDQASENAFVPTAEDSFVTAHEATNVVIVKAPAKLQSQFARIIGELDVRRPQVYVEAKILAVSNTSDFRMRVEGQLKAGQFQTQTAFGIGTQGTGGAYTDAKLPIAGLAGATAALIKSDYVPFILNAIQTDTDARILSSPQLLVNDNEEAEIVSLEQQPTTTTVVGQNTDQTSFGGYQDAGTTLTVTPSISEAGYLRLKYEIELSNFTGSSTSPGVPPPKNTRNVRSDSVTIPTDTTIVVGGITVTDTRDTVIKVPILGDIPILGLLFRDTGKVNNEQVLYIFITPRILNDRNFADLRLLTKGPQDVAGIDPDLPALEPATIDLINPPTAALPPADDAPTLDDPTIIPLIENDAGVVRRGEGG